VLAFDVRGGKKEKLKNKNEAKHPNETKRKNKFSEAVNDVLKIKFDSVH
jgi:hypothetical protein